MANKGQIAMIHVLKSKLSLPDDHYQDMLSAYNVSSSKDLSILQAKNFIESLIRLSKDRNMQIAKSNIQPLGMANKAQKAMLYNMWMQVSRQVTDAEKLTAFRIFVKNRFRIDSIEWLPSSAVPKIKKTLEAMGATYAPTAG